MDLDKPLEVGQEKAGEDKSSLEFEQEASYEDTTPSLVVKMAGGKDGTPLEFGKTKAKAGCQKQSLEQRLMGSVQDQRPQTGDLSWKQDSRIRYRQLKD